VRERGLLTGSPRGLLLLVQKSMSEPVPEWVWRSQMNSKPELAKESASD
jgi:hypothetical protein